MSGFIIDTGSYSEANAAAGWAMDKRTTIIHGVLDALPEGADQWAIDAGLVTAILGELHTPKKLETVRRHLRALWPIIAKLADTDPAGFDEIITTYAELATVLPEGASEGIARRKASAAMNR